MMYSPLIQSKYCAVDAYSLSLYPSLDLDLSLAILLVMSLKYIGNHTQLHTHTQLPLVGKLERF